MPRGEILSLPVTNSLGAMAANLTLQLLDGTFQLLGERNLLYFDLAKYSIEALPVDRRKDCDICGARNK